MPAPASGNRTGRHRWLVRQMNANAEPIMMIAGSLVSVARPMAVPAATSQPARVWRLAPIARHSNAAVVKNAIGPSSMIWRPTTTW